MPRSTKAVAYLATLTGILTIITAIWFARMPDPFVRQFGWFVVVLGTAGGMALIATGAWLLRGGDRRMGMALLVVLALGDLACNLAAFRAGYQGVVPIPSALHAVSTISATILGCIAMLGIFLDREAAPRRPAVLAAGLITVGAVVGGFVVFGSLTTHALQPRTAADESCGSPTLLFGRPPRDACITREQAKPLSTSALFTGLGGLGAIAVGSGALFGSRRTTRLTARLPFAIVLMFVGAASLTVAARAGAHDFDRLFLSDEQAGGSCATSAPARVANVIAPEDQGFRDCVVVAHGTNPLHPFFWVTLATGLIALVVSGQVLPANASRREETSRDSA